MMLKSKRRHAASPPPQETTLPRKRRLFSPASLGITVLLGLVLGLVARGYLNPPRHTSTRDTSTQRDRGVSMQVPNSAAALGTGPVKATPVSAKAPPAARKLEEIPFDAAQAFKYLEQICALGPRVSGSAKMIEQQKLLEEHFTKLGGKVERQEFRVRHPLEGTPVEMTNLIVRWHPEKRDRILLCAHYDTRPFPDRDRFNRQGKFIGANDGGSGTALLMALGDQMAKAECKYGVDFALFDGEELVYRFGEQERGEYFLGAEWFAREYRKARQADAKSPTYRWGVLFDMVGDKNLNIFQEGNSLKWPDTRPLVTEIWSIARRLGVQEFTARQKYEIRDDHLALHDTGGISCCDIIDFDYPHWHTEEDTPDKCSGESLAKVGRVTLEWLRTVK